MGQGNIYEKEYVNYHKHSDYSNIKSLDCVTKMKEYCERAKELGHTVISTVEHGYQGNVFETNTLAEQYNLKMIVGAEAYYVNNRFEKDRSNLHMIIIAKNTDGYKDINRIISKANVDGMYYKPRIDKELLLSINPNNVIITTACTAGILRKSFEDGEEVLKELYSRFKDNLYLEVQNHSHISQVEHNARIIELSNKYGIQLIHANDSHYIYPEDSKYRDLFLLGKEIRYEEEQGFLLDYPSYEEVVKRYKQQGVLSEEQIYKCLDNTLVFKQCENININKDIKLPKISENPKREFQDIIAREWSKERLNIPRERWKEYVNAIVYECSIVDKTNMYEYFILNYKVIKNAVQKYGGVISRTGRGCFTGDSLVHTENGLKNIKDIKIGDKVITKEGKFEEVYNTMSYNIDEEMIQIKHIYGTDKHYPTICTKDHKILINRNDKVSWIQAQDICKGDYVCVPKVTVEDKGLKVIDLNDYNIFGFEYDDKYIYEEVFGISYPYNTTEVAKKIGVGKSIIEDFVKLDCKKDLFSRKPQKLKELMDYIPFNTREEYSQYVKQNRTRKINRYIKVDFVFNQFIGLMYGDGFTNGKSLLAKSVVGLAINNSTEKDIINREIFSEIAKRLGVEIYENKSATKNLSQLYIKSKVFGKFVCDELFISKFGEEKQFNNRWFFQNKNNLLGILDGLHLSDGNNTGERINFDNTSKSIINAYKLLCLMTGVGVNSLSVRPARICERGYNNKESYKLRITPNSDRVVKVTERIKEDNNFWYLPIREIVKLPKMKTTVYDLSVKNNPSYLINNMIVHNSAPSFYINKLLGLTNIDRLDSPITLYPTRFMSVERILGTRSLPDIDSNLADREPFIKATQDILGQDGVHWLLTYKPLQNSSAFRLWCKATNLKYQDYNEIAKNLDSYVEDPYWGQIIKDSEKFVGVIESTSVSPCSFLLLDKPISEEIGILKVGDEYCANLDGYNCDVYKYLKNDYLSVAVWLTISETCKTIGIKIPTIRELLQLLDEKTFSMYELGLTATLNQTDTDFGTECVKKLKPKTVGEMSAFVASIRPGFASLLDNFLNRKPYTTGVSELDELLDDSYHYLMYQESIMKFLVWLGMPESKTYDIIKKISKKKFDEQELIDLKDTLKAGWINHIGTEDGFEQSWKVVEDAAHYSFNASHSLSVALDSLYGAYLKSHYPLQYYTVTLNIFKDDIKKTSKLISELSHFGIRLDKPKFGYSKAKYFYDESANVIYKGVGSIKYLNEEVADKLYEVYMKYKDTFNNFYDVLDKVKEIGINSRQLQILIKVGYFGFYGKTAKLLEMNEIYNTFDKKTYKMDNELAHIILMFASSNTDRTITGVDNRSLINFLAQTIKDKELPTGEIIKAQHEYTGSIDYIDKKQDKSKCVVISLDTKYTPKAKLYRICDGKTTDVKISSKFYNNNCVNLYDTIEVCKVTQKNKKKKVNDEWITLEEVEYFIEYMVV